MKIFISHSSKDKKFVRTLKECLAENNIETWLDEDQIDFGDSLVAKLEVALDDSSHLLLVLSPSTIESEWVKFELKKAIQNNKTGLIKKIIPIKYRDCKIPDTIKDLLYADLSNEIVVPDGEKVKFISEGFNNFFIKLVRAIKKSAKEISPEEKKEIIKTIKSTEKEIEEHTKLIHRGNYRVAGYSTESKEQYQKIISDKLNESEFAKFRPVLLPPGLEKVFRFKLADKIKFEKKNHY